MEFAKLPEHSQEQLPDEEVVTRVLAGERHLFELVMRRHNQRLYRAARAITKSESEAEDVMQDAYVRAYEHLAQFEGRASFSTWLTRIAVHEALARVRKGRRTESLDFSEAEQSMTRLQASSPARNPELTTSDRELSGLMEQAVDALPEGFRAVFMLRAVEEMSVAETAACLDIPEETVKTRLFRARALLQTALFARAEGSAPRTFEFHAPRCDRVVALVMDRIGSTGGR